MSDKIKIGIIEKGDLKYTNKKKDLISKEISRTISIKPQIDNGDILGQKSVKILKSDSMFDIIKRTKKTGGTLMVDVIHNIMTNNIKLIKTKSLLIKNVYEKLKK